MKFLGSTPVSSCSALRPGSRRPGRGPSRFGGVGLALCVAFLFLGRPAPGAATPLAVASVERPGPLDFQREILPILQANCLACHNQTKAKGDLILETPAAIAKGGANGPALVPGKGAESLVFKSAAHQLDDLVMPPAGNKSNARDLTPEELGLLRLWIDQGGRGEVARSDAIAWSSMPTNWAPVLASALSEDGQFAFAGRANRIHVYRVGTRQLVARLEDPSLPDGAAHHDVVNALAISPDGTRLASAGYREVKLWHREDPRPDLVAEPPKTPAPSPETRPVEVRPDGTLALPAWKNLPAVTVSAGGPVGVAAVSPEGTLLAASLGAGGGTRLWRLKGDQAEVVADLRGDRRRADAVVRADAALVLGRADLEFHKGAVQRAEEEVKRTTNALAKASEKHAANEKELAGKREAIAAQEKTKTSATAERDQAAAALDQARASRQSATNSAAKARSAATEAARRAAEARLAAEKAARSKADLERVAADLAGKTDDAAVRRAQELAQLTAADATSRAKAADEAGTAADRALDDLAHASFAAGKATADAERSEADLPPRKKAAEERLAAAVKALGELDGQLKRAEIAVGASEFDTGLSRTNVATAARVQDEARARRTAAEAALPPLEAALTVARQQATNALARTPVAIAFSPDHRLLATLDADGRLAVWTTESGEALELHDFPELAGARLGWSDADTLEFRHANALRRLSLLPRWTLERRLGSDPGTPPFADRVNALAFSPDGRRLATGSGEPSRFGEVRVWRAANGTLERDFGTPHSDAVLSLAFGPDGDLLLSGGADRFMRLLEVGSGRVVRQFEGHTHHVLGVAWRRDGRTVASAGADTVVKTWNRLTGDRIKNVDGFGKEVTGIAAVGVTDQFVAVSGSGQIRVFKENGEQTKTLSGGGAFLQTVAVTSDGRLLATGGDDGVLRVGTLADGNIIAELSAPAATSVASAVPVGSR